jgi:hypothetical protein
MLQRRKQDGLVGLAQLEGKQTTFFVGYERAWRLYLQVFVQYPLRGLANGCISPFTELTAVATSRSLTPTPNRLAV